MINLTDRWTTAMFIIIGVMRMNYHQKKIFLRSKLINSGFLLYGLKWFNNHFITYFYTKFLNDADPRAYF